MPTATKFWLIFPAIALLAMSIYLYLRWPFRGDATEADDEDPPKDPDRLRPLSGSGRPHR